MLVPTDRTEALVLKLGPWRTLTFACGRLDPGDVLRILPGNYVLRNEAGNRDGRAVIHRFGGITIQGNNNAWVVVRANEPGTVNITGHIVFQGSYIRLVDLKITGYSQSNEPGILGFDAHHIDVYNCEVKNCRGGVSTSRILIRCESLATRRTTTLSRIPLNTAASRSTNRFAGLTPSNASGISLCLAITATATTTAWRVR